MRTSVEISDSLLARARRAARTRRTTMRALVEEGLNRVLDEKALPAWKPRRAVFPGEAGLVEPLRAEDLPALLRELRSAGRGAG